MFEEKIIGPIGYEQTPVQIRRAFALGCSGVIVDGSVPTEVNEEVVRLKDKDDSGYSRKFDLGKSSDDLHNWLWPVGPMRVLPKTCSWLQAQAEWAFSSGLRKLTPQHNLLMTVWIKNAFNLDWHIDEAQDDQHDVHIHVYGEGLVVADPGKEVRMCFKPGSVTSNLLTGPGTGADTELQDKGFRLISLLPGQKLVLANECLHRSSDTARDAMKLRAAMF